MIPSIGNKHDLTQIKRQAWAGLDEDRKNPLRLWDRSRIISEYIYNPVLKGRPFAFDVDEYFMMLAAYLKRPQLIIYCRRPLPRIRATLDERDQLAGVVNHLDELHEAYERFMGFMKHMFMVQGMSPGDQVGTGVYEYDYERVDYEVLKPIVRGYVGRFDEEAR